MRAWDVFISHASEDKMGVTLPLARLLQRAGLRVWLDRQELMLGDSLREKIDEGLASSRFGVVVLSPDFLAKGWPRRELDGLFAVEDAQNRTVILPVWHRVDKATLVKYSPILADRLAAKTADGLPSVARQVVKIVTAPGSGAPSDVAPTPLRRLVDLLDMSPQRSDVVGFLASYPGIVQRALGCDSIAGWSTALGPFSVDISASKTQFTTREVTWFLVQFRPPMEPVFIDSALAPSLETDVANVGDLRRWVAANLRVARETLTGITPTFQAVVVAGRRQHLSDRDVGAIRRLNEELPSTVVRTYDWIVDAAADTVQDWNES